MSVSGKRWIKNDMIIIVLDKFIILTVWHFTLTCLFRIICHTKTGDMCILFIVLWQILLGLSLFQSLYQHLSYAFRLPPLSRCSSLFMTISPTLFFLRYLHMEETANSAKSCKTQRLSPSLPAGSDFSVDIRRYRILFHWANKFQMGSCY